VIPVLEVLDGGVSASLQQAGGYHPAKTLFRLLDTRADLRILCWKWMTLVCYEAPLVIQRAEKLLGAILWGLDLKTSTQNVCPRSHASVDPSAQCTQKRRSSVVQRRKDDHSGITGGAVQAPQPHHG